MCVFFILFSVFRIRISKYLLPGKIFVRDINFKNSEFTKGIFVNISLNKKKGCVKNLKKIPYYPPPPRTHTYTQTHLECENIQICSTM